MRARPGRLSLFLAAVHALLIVYASLQPFTGWFDPLPGTPFFLFGRWPRLLAGDVVVNVLGYLPLGLFVGLAAGASPRPWASALLGTLAALVLGFAMEWAQMYLPLRAATPADLAANVAGGALGAGLAEAFARRPRWRARVAALRERFLVGGRVGELGLALLGAWLLAQVNPALPLFSAAFPPPPELVSEPADRLAEAAQTMLYVLGVGLFAALLLRTRAAAAGALAIVIGFALVLKGLAAYALLRPAAFEPALRPGVALGVAGGLIVLPVCLWLGRRAMAVVAAVALLSTFAMMLLLPDLLAAKAPLASFAWRFGHLLTLNGLTQAIALLWPGIAGAFMLLAAAQPRFVGEWAV